MKDPIAVGGNVGLSKLDGLPEEVCMIRELHLVHGIIFLADYKNTANSVGARHRKISLTRDNASFLQT